MMRGLLQLLQNDQPRTQQRTKQGKGAGCVWREVLLMDWEGIARYYVRLAITIVVAVVFVATVVLAQLASVVFGD